MITITFPDRATEKRALAFLLGRFTGRVLQSGEHLLPEAALQALRNQNIPFNVKGDLPRKEAADSDSAATTAGDDSFVDDLLQSNPEFQALAAKSKAGPRTPFPPAK